MISKYNKYYIILIGLLCNSIIVISEEQSLTDQPIVDNIPLNNSIGSTKKSIKILKKSKVLKRKKKKLRKTALRKSSKGSKHKTVNNKSKESTPLSKWAKISLGAMAVGGCGVGWVIKEISKPDKSASSKKETISSQTGQGPSSSNQLKSPISDLNSPSVIQQSPTKLLDQPSEKFAFGNDSLVIENRGKSDQPNIHYPSTLRETSPSSKLDQEPLPSFKKDQPTISVVKSSARPLDPTKYYSLKDLQELKTLFKQLRTLNIAFQKLPYNDPRDNIDLKNRVTIIDKYFPQLNT